MKNLIWLFFGAGILVFYMDTLIPLGYAPWFMYVVLLFLYLNYTNKKHIVYLASFYAFLTIIGFFLSPPVSAYISMPIINRVMGISILIFLAILGMKEEAARKISSEILERIKDLFIAVDHKLRIVFLNKAAQQFVGSSEDVIGHDVLEVIPNHDNVVLKKKLQEAFLTQIPIHFELDLSNSEKYLDVSIYTSKKGLSVFAKDITERVLAEKKLAQLLEEKEVLMREMHHRTKNNFQLVLSLLNLQINSIQDELSVKILNETRSRLSSITLLYDRLFSSGGYYKVDLSMFISDIVNNMESAANFGVIRMKNELNLESAWIGIESAIPLGLIINELYTNSLKYAFNDSRMGSIKLDMKFIDDNILSVKYCDNGKGLPDGFDLENSGGLGGSIVAAFINQLNGSIEYRNNNGAEFEMKLKVDRVKSAENPSLVSGVYKFDL
jgi:PAS domain S-box-containing protein